MPNSPADYSSAIRYFKQGLRYNPGHILMRYNLACTYSLQGNKAKALAVLNQFKREPDCELCEGRLSRARSDPDWKWLWRDSDFKKLTYGAVGRRR